MSDEEDVLEDYESGPYCQHWSDPASCEEMCVCGHTCSEHSAFEPYECENCGCTGFKEKDDE